VENVRSSGGTLSIDQSTRGASAFLDLDKFAKAMENAWYPATDRKKILVALSHALPRAGPPMCSVFFIYFQWLPHIFCMVQPGTTNLHDVTFHGVAPCMHTLVSCCPPAS
jgi:hypothetical protein